VLLVMVTAANVTDRDAAKELLFRLALMHPEIAIVWADSSRARCVRSNPPQDQNADVAPASGSDQDAFPRICQLALSDIHACPLDAPQPPRAAYFPLPIGSDMACPLQEQVLILFLDVGVDRVR
jgi:hypothetical protein